MQPTPRSQTLKPVPWLLSIVGVSALLVVAPIALLLPLGLILGGVSAGLSFLLVMLTVGVDAAGKYNAATYITPAVLSSLAAVSTTIYHVTTLIKRSELPSISSVSL